MAVQSDDALEADDAAALSKLQDDARQQVSDAGGLRALLARHLLAAMRQGGPQGAARVCLLSS